MTFPVWASPGPDGTLLVRIKAVPGASRTRVVGPLGDALKMQVAAPPEAGAANKALVEALAEHLGTASRDVELVAGHASPRKVFKIRGGRIPSSPG